MDVVLAIALAGVHFLLAGHRAGVASGIVDQDVLLDPLAADELRFLAKASELGVLRGQCTHVADDVHEHIGAVDRKTSLARGRDVCLVHDGGQSALVSRVPGITIGRLGELLVGLDDHSLKVLAAADTACSTTARGTVVFVDPAGKPHQVFPCRADGHNADVVFLLIAVALPQDLDCFVDAFPPQVAGVPNLNFAVFHVGIHRFFSLALEYQAVEAGPPQPRRRPAAMMRVCDGTGERRLGDDGHTTAHVGLGAREGAVHEAQNVVRR